MIIFLSGHRGEKLCSLIKQLKTLNVSISDACLQLQRENTSEICRWPCLSFSRTGAQKWSPCPRPIYMHISLPLIIVMQCGLITVIQMQGNIFIWFRVCTWTCTMQKSILAIGSQLSSGDRDKFDLKKWQERYTYDKYPKSTLIIEK